MGVTKRDDRKPPQRKSRPATTPEGRENQLISLAMDLAESQLRDKTATSQVITQFLKLGSTREKLEQDRLRQENEVLKAKVAQMASEQSIEKLYKNAIRAMRGYSGQDVDDEDDNDSDWDDDDD